MQVFEKVVTDPRQRQLGPHLSAKSPFMEETIYIEDLGSCIYTAKEM